MIYNKYMKHNDKDDLGNLISMQFPLFRGYFVNFTYLVRTKLYFGKFVVG